MMKILSFTNKKLFPSKKKVDFIFTYLEDYSDKLHYQTLDVGVDGIIRKAAFEAQDFIDSYLSEVSNTDDKWSTKILFWIKPMKLDQDLNMAVERIEFILEETIKLNSINDQEKDFNSRSAASFPVDRSSTANNMVVGLDDDLNAIKERLYEDSANLQIISVVGMGGMGKTTLARRVYEDSIFSQYFDRCAWITVSQEYQRREILSGLFQYLTKSNDNQYDKSEAELAKKVYQNLVGRRYLIVVDDVWTTKAWDDFKMIFPDEGNGSRILLTTRILDVAAYLGSSDHCPVHQMKLLDEDQSWKLLQERVFGKHSCPLQYVEIGKKIAKNCGGLPLTIVVVAGLLSSGDLMREEFWENISENINSRDPTIALQCTKILCFSYDRLPLRLKPCFLYIGAFPEDDEINVSKLIKLWAAEGFLKPKDHESECLEAVGERYLEVLVKRSLVLVSKRGPDGKLEAVGIHDMLREICISKSEEEDFLHHVSSKVELIESPYRRLKTHSIEERGRLEILGPSVRSVLLSSEIYEKFSLRSRHICILDTLGIPSVNFSGVIRSSTLSNLRYFAFTIERDSCHDEFLLISKHPNLETIEVREENIIFPGKDFQVPYEILKMPKVKHLMIKNESNFCLTYPSGGIENVHESNLQTLFSAYYLIFSEEIIKIFANLKKLNVEYDVSAYYSWDDLNFDNLSRLQNLEDLQITMFHYTVGSVHWNHAFPVGLKKLSLYGVPLDWKNMSIIGSLPNLQVLTMIRNQNYEFIEWKTVEDQFLQLRYLHSDLRYVEKWITEKEHFPCLETLILEFVTRINEIPSCITDIDSLQHIEFRNCKESWINSAKEIQKLQHENGNDVLRVRVIDSFGLDVLF